MLVNRFGNLVEILSTWWQKWIDSNSKYPVSINSTLAISNLLLSPYVHLAARTVYEWLRSLCLMDSVLTRNWRPTEVDFWLKFGRRYKFITISYFDLELTSKFHPWKRVINRPIFDSKSKPNSGRIQVAALSNLKSTSKYRQWIVKNYLLKFRP